MTDRATPDRAATPAPLAREPGMYWVRWTNSGWWPALWSADRWYKVQTNPRTDGRDVPHEIGPRIPSPDDPPTLLAALDGREAGWNYDMTVAPRDGTLLQLIIDHDEGDDCGGGFDDGDHTRTMGFNNFDNDNVDRWVFPGWDWCHDCIIEQGCGQPIAWALMQPLPAPPARPQPAAGGP